MKLHWSPRSPFVRKVMITAHEKGVANRIECVRTVAITTAPSAVLIADNPLNKIPTMVLDDGAVLQDSRVICEYIDALDDRPVLFPGGGRRRWNALRRQALGDGLLDVLVLFRHERNRPPELRAATYIEAYRVKIIATLDRLDREAPSFGVDAIDIGDVAIACALAYLDFRFADLAWREERPQLARWFETFATRPSMAATAIVDDEGALLQAPDS
jgi:glutathione S-transferase